MPITSATNDRSSSDSQIREDGSVIWKGEPLTRISQIKDVARCCQHYLKYGEGNSEDAAPSVIELLMIAGAAKQKLPPEEELLVLRGEVPPPPQPRGANRPTVGKRVNGKMIMNYPGAKAFHAAVAKWENEQEGYPKILAEYESMIPEFQRRVDRWHELHGEEGISKIRKLHKLLRDRIRDLLARVSQQNTFSELGAEEILPPGEWGGGVVLRMLEGGGTPLTREIRERILFLESLKPSKIFRGVVRRQYRHYLLFVFGPDQPAIVESPFYGNATYILDRDPLDLCRRTKRELQQHPDASRLIHTDFDTWRKQICQLLNMPSPLVTDH
ncbi:hypothetical protein HQ447_03960 [bacterium]|nr:hypothetical protein [bacterium]